MEKEINVIWIDDEWDKMTEFKGECEELHIHLKGFKNQKAGIDELNKHPEKWHAVILDGEVNDTSDHEDPSTNGLLHALMHLSALPADKQIPHFISTGKDKVKNNEMLKGETIYIKDIDDERLIDDIKNTVKRWPRYRIQLMYPEATKKLRELNEWACEKVLDILEAMHSSEKKIDPLLYYNPLRQVLEYIFRAANKVFIIPDLLIGDKDDVNINQCVQYLSGRNADRIGIRYGHKNDYIVPAHIRDMMFLVLNLGNNNSHSTSLNDEELKKLGKYFDDNVSNSLYLIYSLALQVCEIVLYMSNYITSHQDPRKNRKMCKTIGIVEKLENNEDLCIIRSVRRGYESCIYMDANEAKSKDLIGKKVAVLSLIKNTNAYNETYPYIALAVQSLEKENGSK